MLDESDESGELIKEEVDDTIGKGVLLTLTTVIVFETGGGALVGGGNDGGCITP